MNVDSDVVFALTNAVAIGVRLCILICQFVKRTCVNRFRSVEVAAKVVITTLILLSILYCYLWSNRVERVIKRMTGDAGERERERETTNLSPLV